MKTDKIYLVGFMGAGKTTVGKVLAQLLSWDFRDTDAETEARMGMTISESEKRFGGMTHFRQMERLTLLSMLDRREVVIATGGGAFASPENRELMLRDGFVAWLDAPFETLAERVARQPDVRPLFRDRNASEALYKKRLPSYGQAHVRVDATKAPEFAAWQILCALEKAR